MKSLLLRIVRKLSAATPHEDSRRDNRYDSHRLGHGMRGHQLAGESMHWRELTVRVTVIFAYLFKADVPSQKLFSLSHHFVDSGPSHE